MAKENYIVGLDIGTQNIRVVQAKVEDDGSLNVIGAAAVPASGMRKGVIVDIEEAVSSISAALEKVERMTGIPVTRANVSVGGNHVTCIDSKGVIAVSRADGEITDNDVVRVIDASQAISIPPNREVLHVIPKTFTLDGQVGIKDPIGMTGIRLEVETIIIHGALPFLKNLNKTITQTGVEVDHQVLSPLAAATSSLNKRQKELGVALVDLGAGTTSIAVYEENNLIHTAVLPIGAMHITNDIAIGLRCTIDTAEKVKLEYGSAELNDIDRHEQIDLNKFDPEETERVARTMIVETLGSFNVTPIVIPSVEPVKPTPPVEQSPVITIGTFSIPAINFAIIALSGIIILVLSAFKIGSHYSEFHNKIKTRTALSKGDNVKVLLSLKKRLEKHLEILQRTRHNRPLSKEERGKAVYVSAVK
jgi:cell division protein FtsA